jgi:peptidoglycan/xylan/chitin deacetylase (PgdA/CDA1 family)
VKYRVEHRLPPAKSVVITFDDGYADNFEIALPVLEQFSFPATFFLVSNANGTAAWASVPELKQRRLTSLSEAKTYLDRVDFGAHTRTHPRLTTLTPVELEDEVGGSKRELEETLAVPVTTFAYPFGNVNDGVRAAVEEAGFLVACGVRSGRNVPATDRYDLRRLEVRGSDSLFRFIVMLWLGDTRSLFGRS